MIPPDEASVVDAPVDVSEDIEDALQDVVLDAEDDGPDVVPLTVVVGLRVTPTEEELSLGHSWSMDSVLVALAAGSRAVVVDEPWSDLPVSHESWERLGALGAYLGSERRQLFLSVAVVDALMDRRPDSLRVHGWSSIAVRQQMRLLLDHIYETLGSELKYVSLAVDVDRYLVAHPSRAADFVAMMTEALVYGREHESKPEGTSLGVTWSTRGWLEGSASAYRDALVQASDVVMFAHDGLVGAGGIQSPEQSLGRLREAVQSVEGKRVVLHRVSYSTSGLIGGSEAFQSDFMGGLFETVDELRPWVSFLGVATLHDPSLESCLDFAQAREPDGSESLYAYWCSVGLRTRHGQAKKAFPVFLSGASGLMGP